MRPMTSSRSASVVVSDAVCASSELTFPASPCSVLMISMAKELTSLGFSAANSGLNPLKSTVRSSAGWVCRSGMVPFSVRRPAVPGALRERDVALADEVAVADQRVGARRDRPVVVDA